MKNARPGNNPYESMTYALSRMIPGPGLHPRGVGRAPPFIPTSETAPIIQDNLPPFPFRGFAHLSLATANALVYLSIQ